MTICQKLSYRKLNLNLITKRSIIKLIAIYNQKAFLFNVILYRDKYSGEQYFLIIADNFKYIIAEKSVPSGLWSQKSGYPVSKGLMEAMFAKIDEAGTDQISNEQRPLEELAARVNQLHWHV